MVCLIGAGKGRRVNFSRGFRPTIRMIGCRKCPILHNSPSFDFQKKDCEMAMESACRLQMGRDRFDGKVRMEADHIDFAGSTKYRFRLTEITQPRKDESAILFGFHGHTVTIDLGNLKTADNWI